jgi:transcription elongation GreA/GreB family factor
MKKALLIKRIIAKLAESVENLERAARASHAEATHESSKAESKYDTRGLEAAYLAGGQARQAKELLQTIEAFEKLPVKPFGVADAIDLGALVELEMDGATSSFFIGPKGGGLEVEHAGAEITVITPQSPLGEGLVGRKKGERWTSKLGGRSVKYHIAGVS